MHRIGLKEQDETLFFSFLARFLPPALSPVGPTHSLTTDVVFLVFISMSETTEVLEKGSMMWHKLGLE